MEESVIRCGGFWTELPRTQERCSQAVEILPWPLLVLEEERRFQLPVDRLTLEPSFPSSPAPLVSSGWMSGEDAEPEDELCLVLVTAAAGAAENGLGNGPLYFRRHRRLAQLIQLGPVRLSFLDSVPVLQ